MSVKDELRRSMRAMRSTLDRDQLDRAGQGVATRLLEHKALLQARSVLCYVSVRREVPTGALIAVLQARGVSVAVPRMLDRTRMEARQLDGPLVDGAMGIPTSDGPRVDTVDVCICPGLAFDRDGGRLGYGGGTYDTWLAEHPVRTIGLCVEGAVVDAVPRELHDRRMDFVVTPERVIRTVPLRVVAALWIRDGRVLAAQRSTGRSAGLWEFPGGKVDPGETDTDALVREIEEELCCRVRADPTPAGETTYRYPDLSVHIVALWVHGEGEPRLTEHLALRWLGPHELESVDWVPADVALLPAVRARLSQN